MIILKKLCETRKSTVWQMECGVFSCHTIWYEVNELSTSNIYHYDLLDMRG